MVKAVLPLTPVLTAADVIDSTQKIHFPHWLYLIVVCWRMLYSDHWRSDGHFREFMGMAGAGTLWGKANFIATLNAKIRLFYNNVRAQ